MTLPASSVSSSELPGPSNKPQKQVIELSDTDDSATECSDSDIELVTPLHAAATVKRRKLDNEIPAGEKGKGKGRAVQAVDYHGGHGETLENGRKDPVDDEPVPGPSRSKKTRPNQASKELVDETAFPEQQLLPNGVNELDDDAYARALFEALNGVAYMDGIVPSFPSTSTFNAPLQTFSSEEPEEEVEDDATLAARLAAEDEESQERAIAQRKIQEESDALYARVTAQAEELAERVQRENKQAGGQELEKKIAFQVTMDGDGKTIEGDEDADNLLHLALVRNDFLANGAQAGLKINKVTYLVNFNLNQRFEAAKDALAEQGRDARERTLFHGTADENIQPILENGFRVGGVDGAKVVNGTACGLGVYLASSPLTSVGYCRGSSRMFACRVVTGLTTPQAQHTPPLPVGQNTFDAYENGGIVVARHSHQVLPKYLVDFSYDIGGINYARQIGIPILAVAGGAGGAGGAGARRVSKAKAPKKAKKARAVSPPAVPLLPGAVPQLVALLKGPPIDPITMQPRVGARTSKRKRG